MLSTEFRIIDNSWGDLSEWNQEVMHKKLQQDEERFFLNAVWTVDEYLFFQLHLYTWSIRI